MGWILVFVTCGIPFLVLGLYIWKNRPIRKPIRPVLYMIKSDKISPLGRKNDRT